MTYTWPPSIDSNIRAMMGAAREEFGHLGEALVTRVIDEMMRQMHKACRISSK
jgi:hypothetical protein